ncbi:cation channel sperm-associated protein 4 isoform X1 [Alligator mississippiensis]|uniref:cation channel sperm-associated protein 4 isoform X1 n=2 Tax=Alligator mississippiensis TaxID=8496 RepID=UPI0009076ADC|nr:cation channel sperm-associated protein 4 isoform X1 [Alligator mississippiensis]XP_059585451.1 cation channel sperm-associated protein 4 isoform X1 [Alligator mississippiensis]
MLPPRGILETRSQAGSLVSLSLALGFISKQDMAAGRAFWQQPDSQLPKGRKVKKAEMMINWRDIMRTQDDGDMEEYVSKVCTGQFLNHWAFKLMLAGLIVSNVLTIASQTDPKIQQNYFGLFSAIDNIVLTVLITEVLLNWYKGFWVYWKDGWNIADFLIVLYLVVGPAIPLLNDQTVFKILRVVRLVHVCTLVKGLARMIRVILRSIPDMFNIMVLLFVIMLVFSVFGVMLFGNLVPEHFGNLGKALYSLFICLTQDGWMNIYEDFKSAGLTLKVGGTVYFFIFLTGGAFICTNLLVAVVSSNLEQMLEAYTKKKARGLNLAMDSSLEANGGDDNVSPDVNLVHMRVAVKDPVVMQNQEPWTHGNLANLTEATCDDFSLVLEAIQENLKQYKEIRDELDAIVQEMRSLRFNQEQEHEMVLRNIQNANLSDDLLGNELVSGQTGDILSTLITLDRAKMIDSEHGVGSRHHVGSVKKAFLKARHQSQPVP